MFSPIFCKLKARSRGAWNGELLVEPARIAQLTHPCDVLKGRAESGLGEKTCRLGIVLRDVARLESILEHGLGVGQRQHQHDGKQRRDDAQMAAVDMAWHVRLLVAWIAPFAPHP